MLRGVGEREALASHVLSPCLGSRGERDQLRLAHARGRQHESLGKWKLLHVAAPCARCIGDDVDSGGCGDEDDDRHYPRHHNHHYCRTVTLSCYGHYHDSFYFHS